MGMGRAYPVALCMLCEYVGIRPLPTLHLVLWSQTSISEPSTRGSEDRGSINPCHACRCHSCLGVLWLGRFETTTWGHVILGRTGASWRAWGKGEIEEDLSWSSSPLIAVVVVASPLAKSAATAAPRCRQIQRASLWPDPVSSWPDLPPPVVPHRRKKGGGKGEAIRCG